MTKRALRGAGPWEFEAPELAPGESHRLDFRNMAFNGRPGYFREFLPLDDAQVTNSDDSATVRVSINHEFGGRVQPNTERPFSDAGVTYLTLENIGSTTIPAGEVVAEVSASGYDADDEARRAALKRNRNPVERALRDVIPGFSP